MSNSVYGKTPSILVIVLMFIPCFMIVFTIKDYMKGEEVSITQIHTFTPTLIKYNEETNTSKLIGWKDSKKLFFIHTREVIEFLINGSIDYLGLEEYTKYEIKVRLDKQKGRPTNRTIVRIVPYV